MKNLISKKHKDFASAVFGIITAAFAAVLITVFAPGLSCTASADNSTFYSAAGIEQSNIVIEGADETL
nr:hypothetical protein [Lachnospiraceae bacterium]